MASHFLPHLDKDASALWKNFRRIIPSELIQQGEMLSRSVVVSIPVSPFEPAVLQKMIDHISLKTAVEFTYSSPYKGCAPEKKVVSPWGVYFQSHAWYLWGGSEQYPCGATYRLSRISEISQTCEPSIAPPDDCGVEQYAGSAWFARPGELVHDIKLHLFPPLSHIVKETTWHRTQEVETLDDGSIIYTAKVPDIEEVARWAMSCAPHVEALAPVELRERMFELGSDVARRHENS